METEEEDLRDLAKRKTDFMVMVLIYDCIVKRLSYLF